MSELTRLFSSKLYLKLNAPAYPLAEVSRLVGISKGRVARWLRGYEYTYEVAGGEEIREGQQDAIVHRSGPKTSTYASFLDLIDLLFVKRFLSHGYSLQFIRSALDEARDYLQTPHFASTRFFIGGGKIILDKNGSSNNIGNLIALLTGGQLAFRQIIEQVWEKIDFEEVTGFGLASRWFPCGRDDYIVVDPEISFGRPTIKGRRVTTANIFDLYLGENKKITEVNRWFQQIPATEIQSAVNFEYSIHA